MKVLGERLARVLSSLNASEANKNKKEREKILSSMQERVDAMISFCANLCRLELVPFLIRKFLKILLFFYGSYILSEK